MAKISPVSIKYMVYASFKAEGPLEKPDVIGAIFGQTEGLLGNDLEMRELQKEGKIGRIEVDLEIVDGKSVGEIKLPSALDKSETTLVAAALETIDRIGPTEAHIEILKIEDVRGSKRDYILDRAKKLLDSLEGGDSFKEISQSLKEDARVLKIQEYGENKVPAGDLSGNEIIVVEGRADVVNLLKNRVYNVVGMNGTKLPPEIAQLGEQKELTLFVDGDRGGKLIAKNVINNAKIAYIAVAPDGKEVEELAGKEILIALRKKIPAQEFMNREGRNLYDDSEAASPVVQEPAFEGDAKEKLREQFEKIRGTKMAALLDNHLDAIRRVTPRDVPKSIRMSRQKVFAVVIDGAATGTIVKSCDENNVSFLAATNFSPVEDAHVQLVSV